MSVISWPQCSRRHLGAGERVKCPCIRLRCPIRPVAVVGMGRRAASLPIRATSKELEEISSPKMQKPVDAESARELVEELMNLEEFGKRGELWFVLQMTLILLVVFPPGGIRQIVDVMGYSAVLFGLTIISVAGFDLGQSLTPVPKPRESNVLTTTGMYELCRHPMYGGSIIAAAGLSLATGDVDRILLTVLLAFGLDRKASYEESLLEERYGSQYTKYKSNPRVKKLIPWLW